MEKRKETISDLPRQGGQKKKMGKHFVMKLLLKNSLEFPSFFGGWGSVNDLSLGFAIAMLVFKN